MLEFLNEVLMIEDLEPDAYQMGISGKSGAKNKAPDGGKAGIKGDFNALHPRYPKGHPQGGKFMPKGSKDQIKAIAKNTGQSVEKVAAAVGSKAPANKGKLKKFSGSAGAVGKAQKVLKNKESTPEQRAKAKASIAKAAGKMRGEAPVVTEKPKRGKISNKEIMARNAGESKPTTKAPKDVSKKTEIAKAPAKNPEVKLEQKPVKAKKEKGLKTLSSEQISKRVASGKPIKSNEVPDNDRLGSARLLQHGKPAKSQQEAQDLIIDASHRLNNEFGLDGGLPVEKLRKALGTRISDSQFKSAIYDGFNSRVQAGNPKNPQGFIDVNKIPKEPSKGYKSVSEVSAIKESDFHDVLNKTVKDLDKDGRYKGLVPLYQIRRNIGSSVSRADFNNYLKNLQSKDRIQMQGGGIEDDAKDKLEDSIYTKTSGLRSYLKILK